MRMGRCNGRILVSLALALFWHEAHASGAAPKLMKAAKRVGFGCQTPFQCIECLLFKISLHSIIHTMAGGDRAAYIFQSPIMLLTM